MRTPRLIGAVTTALAFGALPTAAHAATTSVSIGGTVASSLTLTVPTPAAMTLTPGQTSTTTSTMVVASTLPSWTMTIADQNSGAGAGKLKLAGSSPGTFTDNALQFNVDGGTYKTLTGTPQTVMTGGLLSLTPLLGFKLIVDPTEQLKSGDTWSLTASVVIS